MKTILIAGLPGSGKTFLATTLKKALTDKNCQVEWFNADQVREQFNDWDFSPSGRHRQMTRMKILADKAKANGSYVICDFVCPTKQLRKDFAADFVVWMNTIDKGRFEDTNQIFETLDSNEYHAIITEHEWWDTQHAKQWSQEIIRRLETNAKL